MVTIDAGSQGWKDRAGVGLVSGSEAHLIL